MVGLGAWEELVELAALVESAASEELVELAALAEPVELVEWVELVAAVEPRVPRAAATGRTIHRIEAERPTATGPLLTRLVGLRAATSAEAQAIVVPASALVVVGSPIGHRAETLVEADAVPGRARERATVGREASVEQAAPVAIVSAIAASRVARVA